MNILVVDNNQEDMSQTLKAVYPYASLIPSDDAMAAVHYGLNYIACQSGNIRVKMRRNVK